MKLVLELGSGANPVMRQDATVIHLDKIEGKHVELVADLNHGIPTPSNLFDEIVAHDVLEHLDDIIAIVDEMHRVLKPGGTADIRVPQAGSYNHVTDPTHVRGFGLDSFDFFDDTKPLADNGRVYTKRRWKILSKGPVNLNFEFKLQALKPSEVPNLLKVF